MDESEGMSERKFGSEFNRIYNTVRKGTVLISEKKKLKMLSNEDAYNELITFLFGISNI